MTGDACAESRFSVCRALRWHRDSRAQGRSRDPGRGGDVHNRAVADVGPTARQPVFIVAVTFQIVAPTLPQNVEAMVRSWGTTGARPCAAQSQKQTQSQYIDLRIYHHLRSVSRTALVPIFFRWPSSLSCCGSDPGWHRAVGARLAAVSRCLQQARWLGCGDKRGEESRDAKTTMSACNYDR
jgi:hypothetical protein